MGTKIYVCLTGKVPSVFFSTIAKPIKISNSIGFKFVSIDDLSNLVELTKFDTYSNLISNAEFKEALRFNTIKAYDEYALEIDVFKDKYPDLPEVTLESLPVNPIGLNHISSTNLNDFIPEVDDLFTSITNAYEQAISDLDSALSQSISNLNSDLGTLSSTVGTLGNNLGTLSSTVGGLSSDLGTLSSTVGGLDQDVITLTQDVASNTDGLIALRALNLFPDQYDIKNNQFVYSNSANGNKCVEFITPTGANGWDVSRTGGGNAPSYVGATVDGQNYQAPFISMSTPIGYTYLITPFIYPNSATGKFLFEAVIAFSTNFTDTANNSIYVGITTMSNIPVNEALTGYGLFLRRNPTVNSGNWQVVKVINGVTTILLNTAVGFSQSTWLKFKIVMDRGANKAYYYLNGANVHTENNAGINTQQFWRAIMGQTSNVVNSSSWVLRFKDALYNVS